MTLFISSLCLNLQKILYDELSNIDNLRVIYDNSRYLLPNQIKKIYGKNTKIIFINSEITDIINNIFLLRKNKKTKEYIKKFFISNKVNKIYDIIEDDVFKYDQIFDKFIKSSLDILFINENNLYIENNNQFIITNFINKNFNTELDKLNIKKNVNKYLIDSEDEDKIMYTYYILDQKITQLDNRIKKDNITSKYPFDKNKPFIIVDCIMGLCNRLRAIASAYSICKKLNYQLIINCKKDDHFNCELNELFPNINDFGILINSNINLKELSDEFKINIKKYNYYEVEADGKKDEYIDTTNYKYIYVKSNCALNHNYSFTFFKDFLVSLSFNNKINKLIKNIDTTNMIGMHIRHHNINTKPDSNNNWTKKETNLLEQWREASHVDNFINIINNILSKNKNAKFYIGTDSEDNYNKLINIYGDKINYIDTSGNNKRDIDSVIFAVADIILLARCKEFYGSTWSSFSEIIPYFQEKNTKNTFSKDFVFNKPIIKKLLKGNIFGKKVKSGNVIITACMNRNSNLKEAIKSWIKVKDLNQIVIVDYNSKKQVSETLKDINSNLIKIVRVDNVKKWCLTKAFNLAIKCVDYSNIYKLDCEDIITDDIIIKNPINKYSFFRGDYKKAKSTSELQINGKLFCNYFNLIKINGYNENITTYGWDDDDIYKRLKNKLTEKIIDIKYFKFISHDDKSRLTNTKYDKEVSIMLNQYLANDNILFWNKNCLQTKYIYKNNEFEEKEVYNIDLKNVNKKQINDKLSILKYHYPSLYNFS